MSRITGSDAKSMMEAYSAVYDNSQEQIEKVDEIVEDQNSDVEKTFKSGTREFTKNVQSLFPYVTQAADLVGSAISGTVQGMGGPNLTRLGRKAEKLLGGTGGETPKQKPSKVAKPGETEQQRTISKLYEDNVSKDAPLTISGGRTGTGLGKKFKPRNWTPGELQRYKELRGPERLKSDKQFQQDMVRMNRQIARTPPGRDPEFYRPATTTPAATTTPPAAAPRAAKPAAATTPAAPAPKPLETRMSAVTGKREFVGTTPSGQKFERRAATSAELKAAQAARQAALTAGKSKPEAEKAAVSAGVLASKTQKEERMDAFDLVLEYLTSEGHVETLDEALYVMMEMDSETIQSICEAKYGTKAGRKKLAKKIRKGEEVGKSGPGTGFKAVEAKAKKYGARDPKAVAAAAMWKTYGGKKEE